MPRAMSHLNESLSMIGWRSLLAGSLVFASRAAAQDTTGAVRSDPVITLSLSEALQQARRSSPVYRQALNDASPARWGVRNAYGNLLPSFSASTDIGYTGSGQSNLGGGFTLATSPFVTSGYSLGLQWQLSGRSLTAPAQQKALQNATEQDIAGAAVALTADISTQYLNTLQASAQVQVARQQVRRNEDFLELARARHRSASSCSPSWASPSRSGS
jgi:outer membrane protein TolC